MKNSMLSPRKNYSTINFSNYSKLLKEKCLICKGDPVNPKTCNRCTKSVCTPCIINMIDKERCPECMALYNQVPRLQQSSYLSDIKIGSDSSSNKIPNQRNFVKSRDYLTNDAILEEEEFNKSRKKSTRKSLLEKIKEDDEETIVAERYYPIREYIL
jgi:hypothetical protein